MNLLFGLILQGINLWSSTGLIRAGKSIKLLYQQKWSYEYCSNSMMWVFSIQFYSGIFREWGFAQTSARFPFRNERPQCIRINGIYFKSSNSAKNQVPFWIERLLTNFVRLLQRRTFNLNPWSIRNIFENVCGETYHFFLIEMIDRFLNLKGSTVNPKNDR